MALNNAPNVRFYGPGAIRFCISGAAPPPVEVREIFEKLTRGRLVEGYGLPEASPATHASPFESTVKEGSIRIPLPNTEATVVDLMSGADLPKSFVGKVLRRMLVEDRA